MTMKTMTSSDRRMITRLTTLYSLDEMQEMMLEQVRELAQLDPGSAEADSVANTLYLLARASRRIVQAQMRYDASHEDYLVQESKDRISLDKGTKLPYHIRAWNMLRRVLLD